MLIRRNLALLPPWRIDDSLDRLSAVDSWPYPARTLIILPQAIPIQTYLSSLVAPSRHGPAAKFLITLVESQKPCFL